MLLPPSTSSPPEQTAFERREITLSGITIGVLLTLVFTAANVYFGLRAGLTFATSIPAAVISMAILRRIPGSTVQENNIVQTIASAAGTLSSVIFVLPGLVMIGWWTGFPYLYTFAICALGGVLGVMYSIPLRRALVVDTDLPYPEGVACAEVLKVGAGGSTQGLRALLLGSITSAVFAVVVAAQLFASDLAQYFRFGSRNGATGYDFALSFGLFAVGHLVGLWVGIAMVVGALITWGGVVPYLSSISALSGDAFTVATRVWSQEARFVGAGTIAISAIWTLITMVRPVYQGVASALAASRARRSGSTKLPRTEQDIPIGIVGIVCLATFVPIAILLASLALDSGLGALTPRVAAGSLIYIVVMGFFVATVCGYMAGLIGASNSPISGMGILAVVGAAPLLVLFVKPFLPASAAQGLVAYALFVTAVVLSAATIANDNLQDLKTGQLVDATPWRQQVALVIGVIAGALVIPPVLDLINRAYGFAGAPNADPSRALAAPQAALISAIARGIVQADLQWAPIGVGAIIGVALIVINIALRRFTRGSLPPLAVGLGMYLPSSVTLISGLGAVAGWLYERRARRTADPEGSKQLGTLIASGMIVGESLIGVVLAALVVFSGKGTPLAVVGASFVSASQWLGGIAFVVSVGALYLWCIRRSGPRVTPSG